MHPLIFDWNREEPRGTSRPLVQLDDRDYKAALESQRARLAVAKANKDLHAIDLKRKQTLREHNYAS